MSWYKLATDLGERFKIVDKIIHSINGADQYFNESKAGISSGYVEFEIQDAHGTAYISISYSDQKDQFLVEKYYESEFMQNEFGETKYIDVNYGDPSMTVRNINATVDSLR